MPFYKCGLEARLSSASAIYSPAGRNRNNPIAFISSFYQEAGYESTRDSPLWQLRQELAGLNEDDAFRRSIGLSGTRPLTWVAEKSDVFQPEPDWLGVADHLIEILRDSDFYICILADKRRGDKEHGSPILLRAEETSVSFFEIELYAAAMYGKRICPFVLNGFDPGLLLASFIILDVVAFSSALVHAEFQFYFCAHRAEILTRADAP